MDTKWLALQEGVNLGLHLGSLYSTVQEPPFHAPPHCTVNNRLTEREYNPIIDFLETDVGYSAESNRLHEAGYDAYVTGISFLALCIRLEELKSNPPAGPDNLSPKKSTAAVTDNETVTDSAPIDGQSVVVKGQVSAHLTSAVNRIHIHDLRSSCVTLNGKDGAYEIACRLRKLT